MTSDRVRAALAAGRETRSIEFKSGFYPAEPGAWCELLKDIAAIANSGGGVIVIGVADDGTPTGWDTSLLSSVDFADVMNTFTKYLGEDFDDFEIAANRKRRVRVATIEIDGRIGAPLVFQRQGSYDDGTGRQKSAFAQGTVYFRHGAKSEAARSRDIQRFVEREIKRVRREWMSNVRRGVTAPQGSQVLLSGSGTDPGGRLGRFRVVDDPDAPAAARTDFDATHPYRQKELVAELNRRLGRNVVGPFDLQCIRRVYDIDTKLDFFHKPKFGSPQYSDTFVGWLVNEHGRDPQFFAKARDEDRNRRSDVG